jgi:hypothetical protein
MNEDPMSDSAQQQPHPASGQQPPQPEEQQYAPPEQPQYAPPAEAQYAPPAQVAPYVHNPYQQPQYGQYGQAYYAPVTYAPYAPPQPKPLSITAMVLGIVSVVFWFTFLVPVGALVFGIIGLKKEPAGRGMSITGIVLGSICLLGTVIVVVLWIVLALAAIGTAGVVGSSGYPS